MIVKWCRVPEGVFSHICVAEIVVIVQVAPVSFNQNNKETLLLFLLPFLGHRAEHWVVPTDGWAVLIVLCFGVANLVELGLKLITIYCWPVRISTVSYRGRQHASSEPDRVPLHLVLDNLNLYWFWLKKEIYRKSY